MNFVSVTGTGGSLNKTITHPFLYLELPAYRRFSQGWKAANLLIMQPVSALFAYF
jgi:hypothetical protein